MFASYVRDKGNDLTSFLPTHSLPAKSTSCSFVFTLCLPLVEEPLVRVGEGDLDRAAAVPGAGDLERDVEGILRITQDVTTLIRGRKETNFHKSPSSDSNFLSFDQRSVLLLLVCLFEFCSPRKNCLSSTCRQVILLIKAPHIAFVRNEKRHLVKSVYFEIVLTNQLKIKKRLLKELKTEGLNAQ